MRDQPHWGHSLSHRNDSDRSFDPALKLLDDINAFLDRAIDGARKDRSDSLSRSYTDVELNGLAEKKRIELARYIGVVDQRKQIDRLRFLGSTAQPSLVGGTDAYDIYAVQWSVLDGIDGEGLWIKPKSTGGPRVIAIPDADGTPAGITGVDDSLPPQTQFARRLADMGCEVIVPFLINRECTWSGHPNIRMTNQPHREYVYRMAFQMGRHIVGYEVQKILALVDYFTFQNDTLPILAFGYGEGGLLALHSTALDERIDGVGVSGYFGDRFQVFNEPIYRNVWRQLRGFSDAELASIIAPRTVVVETSPTPIVYGPPVADLKRRGAAPGKISTPTTDEIRAEVSLASHAFEIYGVPENLKLIECQMDRPGPGTDAALVALLEGCGARAVQHAEPGRAKGLLGINVPDGGVGKNAGVGVEVRSFSGFDDEYDQTKRQLNQMTAHVQSLWRKSSSVRDQFWSDADVTSLDTWQMSLRKYRRCLWDEVIGRAPKPDRPPNGKTRIVEQTSTYDVKEITIDVWDGVSAFAYLLLPTEIPANEKRPVIVIQHGLGGDPKAVFDSETYKSVGRRLAEMGYIVVAPQSPFVGPAGDRFRILQRKANPLGWSLFSFFVEIHKQWIVWLKSLSFVDPDKIGFYGLSYGGKTAMRVPALLTEYALSICSGDYNEWIMKTVSDEFFSSYVFTGEYEIWEFDLGHTFNYAEMTYLIAPRPFMVERGTKDACSTDEWVAFEYAKAHRKYLRLGVADRIELEVFDGGHEINFRGTKRFLERYLPIVN